MTGVWPAVAALVMAVVAAFAAWWGWDERGHTLRLQQELRATQRDLQCARLEADERLDMLIGPVEQALTPDQEQ